MGPMVADSFRAAGQSEIATPRSAARRAAGNDESCNVSGHARASASCAGSVVTKLG
jgi:hypothetical protein